VCVIIHPGIIMLFFKYVYCISFLLIVGNFNIIRTKLQFVRYVLQRYFIIKVFVYIEIVCS
jgi:hypothetical protein